MPRDVLIDEEIVTLTEMALSQHITREMIKQLRLSLRQNMSEFGLTLKRATDPKAKRPYSRQYINGLETGKGRYPITPEIESAFWSIAAAADDVPAGTGGAVLIKVLAQPGQFQEGTFIKRTMQAKRCARPGCSVVFVGPGKYHDPDCQKVWAKERIRIAKDKMK